MRWWPFHRHTWGQWEKTADFEVMRTRTLGGVSMGDPVTIGRGFYQERRCETCGYRQIKCQQAVKN